MQETSELYKSLLSSGTRRETRLTIAGEVYGEDRLVSVTKHFALFENDAEVGNAVASKLSVSLIRPGSIPKMAEIKVEIRLNDGELYSEWLSKGTFYIDTRDFDDALGTLTIEAYDAMLKGDVPYISDGEAQSGWPKTDLVVVNEICERLGVTLDSRTAEIITNGYEIQFPGYGEGAYTVRETLGYIGAMYAGNWVITDDGYLRLIRLNGTPPETSYLIDESGNVLLFGDTQILVSAPTSGSELIDADTDKTYVGMYSQNLKIGEVSKPYNKVVITVGSTTDSEGQTTEQVYTAEDYSISDGETLEVTCPWGTQAVAYDVLKRISGFVYQPFQAKEAVLDPAAEIGDGVTISGMYSVIGEAEVTFSALYQATISAPGDSQIKHEYGMYVSARDRQITRQIAGVKSSLRLGIDSIIAEVDDFENNVNTSLAVMNGQITSKISRADAYSMINQSIDGITLTATAGNNQSTVRIRANGVEVDSTIVKFSNIVADSIVANSSIEAPNLIGGKLYADTAKRIWQTMYWNVMGETATVGGNMIFTNDYASGQRPVLSSIIDGSTNDDDISVAQNLGDFAYLSANNWSGTNNVNIGDINGNTTLNGNIRMYCPNGKYWEFRSDGIFFYLADGTLENEVRLVN